MAIANGGPASNLRKRKSENGLKNSDVVASGQSTAVLKLNGIPTEHGQEIDRKMDEHST